MTGILVYILQPFSRGIPFARTEKAIFLSQARLLPLLSRGWQGGMRLREKAVAHR